MLNNNECQHIQNSKKHKQSAYSAFAFMLKDRNITVYRLHKMTGISTRSLYLMRDGYTALEDCSLKTVNKIKEALGFNSMDEFLNYLNSWNQKYTRKEEM
jgi:DNA-binding Xre family transcriptional regulator